MQQKNVSRTHPTYIKIQSEQSIHIVLILTKKYKLLVIKFLNIKIVKPINNVKICIYLLKKKVIIKINNTYGSLKSYKNVTFNFATSTKYFIHINLNDI